MGIDTTLRLLTKASGLTVADLATAIPRAGASTVSSRTASSTSPVGSLGLIASGARRTTSPATVTTVSGRSPCTASKKALDASTTHCVMP